MAFQSVVRRDQGFGVVGEVVYGAPHSAQPAVIKSVSAAYNVFGRAFTWDSGKAKAGGTGVFLGILIHPKEHASRGTQAGGPLAATLTLANEETGSFLSQGLVLADVGGSADIGDLVVFSTTTGALATIAPDASLPGGHAYAYARVDRFAADSNGLAVIAVDHVPTAPTA